MGAGASASQRAHSESAEAPVAPLKRRIAVIGNFPNNDAIIRIFGAIMLETNDEWTVVRRYMCLETLARVNDNLKVRLSAAAS